MRLNCNDVVVNNDFNLGKFTINISFLQLNAESC